MSSRVFLGHLWRVSTVFWWFFVGFRVFQGFHDFVLGFSVVFQAFLGFSSIFPEIFQGFPKVFLKQNQVSEVGIEVILDGPLNLLAEKPGGWLGVFAFAVCFFCGLTSECWFKKKKSFLRFLWKWCFASFGFLWGSIWCFVMFVAFLVSVWSSRLRAFLTPCFFSWNTVAWFFSWDEFQGVVKMNGLAALYKLQWVNQDFMVDLFDSSHPLCMFNIHPPAAWPPCDSSSTSPPLVRAVPETPTFRVGTVVGARYFRHIALRPQHHEVSYHNNTSKQTSQH